MLQLWQDQFEGSQLRNSPCIRAVTVRLAQVSYGLTDFTIVLERQFDEIFKNNYYSNSLVICMRLQLASGGAFLTLQQCNMGDW